MTIHRESNLEITVTLLLLSPKMYVALLCCRNPLSCGDDLLGKWSCRGGPKTLPAMQALSHRHAESASTVQK